MSRILTAETTLADDRRITVRAECWPDEHDSAEPVDSEITLTAAEQAEADSAIERAMDVCYEDRAELSQQARRDAGL